MRCPRYTFSSPRLQQVEFEIEYCAFTRHQPIFPGNLGGLLHKTRLYYHCCSQSRSVATPPNSKNDFLLATDKVGRGNYIHGKSHLQTFHHNRFLSITMGFVMAISSGQFE